jgi:glyoxylase-like metal-dependent hydrolase (beta-lactamase superfamily II)
MSAAPHVHTTSSHTVTPRSALFGDVIGAGSGAEAAPPAGAAAVPVGPFDVIPLIDATASFFLGWEAAFPEATPTSWRDAQRLDPAAFGGGSSWNLTFRCYAIRRPDGRVTLVDTGIGPEGSVASDWTPVPGNLPAALLDANIAADDVDTVVLSHLHEDHTGWAVGADGVPTFENANYVVQHVELAAVEANGGAVLTRTIEPLRTAGVLRPVHGRIRLPGTGQWRCPGVSVLPTPGHTPGHQSVLVDGGWRRVIITGDVLVHAVQLVDPEVSYRFEANAEIARRTRRRLLLEAANTNALLATAHLTNAFVQPRWRHPERL